MDPHIRHLLWRLAWLATTLLMLAGAAKSILV